MKTMSKLLALILALILTFTCAACGDPENTKSSSKNPKQTTPSSTGSQMTGSLPEEFTTQATSTEPEHNIAIEATQPKEDESTDSTQPKQDEATDSTQPKQDEVAVPSEPKQDEVAVPSEPKQDEVAEPSEPKHDEVAVPSEPKQDTATDATEPNTEPSQPAEDMADNYFFNDTNYAYVVNELSIKPRYVYWQEDGTLVAECFVINGFSHAVYNIEVKTISFANADGLIASANFGALKDLVLGPYQYCVKVFSFPPDCVSNFGASLASLTCNASTSFWY